MRAELGEKLPYAREVYASLFEGLDVEDQLAIQAGAERQGAAAWRGLADRRPREEVLEACARLEEESADFLDALLDQPSGAPL